MTHPPPSSFLPPHSGNPLFVRTLLPAAAPPVAALLWHHGYPQHSGLWDSPHSSFFADLASAGVAVFAHDAAGFGRSAAGAGGSEDALAGAVPSVDALVDDLLAVRATLVAPLETATTPPLPVFLGGVSMGGLVAVHAALRDQGGFAGLILESPALAPVWTPLLRALHTLSPLLERVVPAWVPGVPGPRFATWTPRAPVLTAWRRDPLNPTPPPIGRCVLRVGTARALFDGMAAARARARELTLPLFVASVDDDGAVCPAAVAAFVDAAGGEDNTHVRHAAGAGHCLLLGPAGGALAARVAAWVRARSPAARGALRRAAAEAVGVRGKRRKEVAIRAVAAA